MGSRLESNGDYRVSKGTRINRVLGMKSKGEIQYLGCHEQ